MKFDLLKKLTRLANNNPNENEANLAARRVCKILEESNFSLSEAYTNPKPPSSKPNYSHVNNPVNYNSWVYDWFRDSNEKRYKQYAEGSWDSSQWTDKDRKTSEQAKPKEPFKESNYYAYEPIKQKKEKRTLKCSKCGKMQETLFVGLEDVYECNNCQWTAYIKTKI